MWPSLVIKHKIWVTTVLTFYPIDGEPKGGQEDTENEIQELVTRELDRMLQ